MGVGWGGGKGLEKGREGDLELAYKMKENLNQKSDRKNCPPHGDHKRGTERKKKEDGVDGVPMSSSRHAPSGHS